MIILSYLTWKNGWFQLTRCPKIRIGPAPSLPPGNLLCCSGGWVHPEMWLGNMRPDRLNTVAAWACMSRSYRLGPIGAVWPTGRCHTMNCQGSEMMAEHSSIEHLGLSHSRTWGLISSCFSEISEGSSGSVWRNPPQKLASLDDALSYSQNCFRDYRNEMHEAIFWAGLQFKDGLFDTAVLIAAIFWWFMMVPIWVERFFWRTSLGVQVISTRFLEVCKPWSKATPMKPRGYSWRCEIWSNFWATNSWGALAAQETGWWLKLLKYFLL